MANLREPGARINLELLAEARWFAGKDRTVTDVRTAVLIEPPGARGAAVELVDVAYEDGGEERYALALRDGRECAGDDLIWRALARVAGVDAAVADGFLAHDLSNTVVGLDDRHVLKLYRRPEAGPHPEVELLRALEGSPHAPCLTGSLSVDGTVLVAMQTLVAGEPVGWEALIARLAGGDSAPGLPEDLARVTATLHRALAERLGTTAAGEQRVHGDLHVGQFLRAGDELVVVDWEGEPGLPLAERVRPSSPLRDLASLRLSLAHAARAAHRREPAFDWRAWSRTARAAALAAYAAETGAVDGELLHALEVEKERSELAYAERWLPEWLYVPRDVLPFVLEDRA